MSSITLQLFRRVNWHDVPPNIEEMVLNDVRRHRWFIRNHSLCARGLAAASALTGFIFKWIDGLISIKWSLLESWWIGPGLVGRCPKCGQKVLFAIEGKFPVKDLTALAGAVLHASIA